MPSPRYYEAVRYAGEAHATQYRKRLNGAEVPYLAHLLSVSALVMESGSDEDLCIAALLHDAVEDQGGQQRADDIRARFGERVADVVLGCSDSFTDDPENKPPWRQRKVAYIAHVREASRDVRTVSCADKLHNARSIVRDLKTLGSRTWSLFTASGSDTVWYYQGLVEAFSDGEAPPHLPQLRAVVARMTELHATVAPDE